MTRFVVCGEALIDLIPDGEGTTLASPWRAASAGGPMTTAIALARLGHDVSFLGRLGGDAFGRQLYAHLAASGVGLDLARVTDEATSLAVVSLDEQGKASYTFHFEGTANFGWQPDELPTLGADDWLHIASLVTVIQPGAATLLDWVAAGTGRCSIDVNVRPSVEPDPARYWALVEPWLAAVGARGGLVKGSDEDFEFLAEAGRLPSDPAELAATLAERYGVAWTVVTLGADGVWAGGPDESARVPSPPIELVDTIGAGDTFMAGFLSGLIGDGDTITDAARKATAAAAIVCGRVGANPPTRTELDEAMR